MRYRLKQRLSSLLCCDIFLTLFLLIIIGGPQIFLYQEILSYGWRYSLYLIFLYYIVAYVLAGIKNIFDRESSWVTSILWFVLSFYFTINVYCVKEFHCLVSPQIFDTVLGTNTSEINEFFQTYYNWEDFACVLVAILFCYFSYQCYKQYKQCFCSSNTIPLLLFVLSLILIYRNSSVIKELNYYQWSISFDEVVDLTNHPVDTVITQQNNSHPSRIVVILGESMARSHSSLYGYGVETNPGLQSLYDSGHLVKFVQATAPACNTTEAFRFLLTDYYDDLQQDSRSRWYQSSNLIESFKKAGYHTFWYSNQAESGLYNNLPSGFSKICDQSIFIAHEGYSQYDHELLTVSTQDTIHNNQLIIYHLMGQHPRFKLRYPAQYEYFHSEDYPLLTQYQASIIAAYDNATRYNDYVVSEIIKTYSDKETLLFYLPDHGLDLFVSDPDYAGHGRSDSVSYNEGLKIPFLVYMSSTFQEHFPETESKLKRLSKLPFCSTHFYDLVIDLAGYSAHR